jgi:hypothetical protein
MDKKLKLILQFLANLTHGKIYKVSQLQTHSQNQIIQKQLELTQVRQFLKLCKLKLSVPKLLKAINHSLLIMLTLNAV